AAAPAAQGELAVVLANVDLLAPVERALRALAPAASDLFGGVTPVVIALPPSAARLTAADEQTLTGAAARASRDAGMRIVFTPRRLNDNWFSHWHAGLRVAVVSMADWDGVFAVRPEAFVAYQLLQHGLRLLCAGFAPEELLHDETRGCFFDFCK